MISAHLDPLTGRELRNLRNRTQRSPDFQNMLAQRSERRALCRARGTVFQAGGTLFQPGEQPATLVRVETAAERGGRAASPRRLHPLHEMGSVRRMSLGIWAESQPAQALRGSSPSVVRDTQGIVIIEYVVVLLLVSGLACSAIVVLGMAVARFFFSQEAWLSIPIP